MHALVLLNKDLPWLLQGALAFLTSVCPLTSNARNQMREGSLYRSVVHRTAREIGSKRETLALPAGNHRLQLLWQVGQVRSAEVVMRRHSAGGDGEEALRRCPPPQQVVEQKAREPGARARTRREIERCSWLTVWEQG
jgi:hypothetical protein